MEVLCSRQEAIASWVEAEIGMRQVALVKRRLKEMVEDYGSRAKALEEAIAEIHVDLDRRATAILQLKGAQEAKEATSATSATSVFQEEALEAELLQEESLFHLRHRQVQGLEERLQDLLAQEGPRMEALGAWVAVHEPLLTKELERSEKAEQAAAAEAACEAAKQELTIDLAKQRRSEHVFLAEACAAAVAEAERAARQAAALYRQRGLLLRDVDGLGREERAAAGRAESACQHLRRDRRRAVAAVAKGLWEQGPASLRGVCPKEARQRAAAQAEELVEASRGEQIQELRSLNEEMARVNAEMVELKELSKAEDAQVEAAWKQPNEAQRQLKVAEAQEAVPAARRSHSGIRRSGSVGRKAEPEGRLETVVLALRELEQQQQAEMAARESQAMEIQAALEAAEASLQRCRAENRAESAAALRRLRRASGETEDAERKCCELAAAKERVCRALRDMSFGTLRPSNEVVCAPEAEERRPGDGEAPIEEDLRCFYRQVLPLLQGIAVGALRPPRTALEERQLVLSSDFQRLELWMPDVPATRAAASGPARKRVADTFLRLETLARVHLPKATQLAIQRKAALTSASKSRFSLRFELVVMGSDTWHLATSDVQTLQIITSAVKALLAAKGRLGALALSACGLGDRRKQSDSPRL
ncbi:unnamed protein product [Symbiodinium natans]|uniref:Uncharacterized protein n=1 Tax=Symbiodinium natans TaxID=878477 RepID=A0A812KDC4_9DINO|nr:unnamed protein product [Symbiodinium natans]